MTENTRLIGTRPFSKSVPAPKVVWGALMIAGFALIGCADEPAADGKVGAFKQLIFRVDAETGPISGPNSFLVEVERTDNQKPFEDATLTTTAFMPKMNHGTTEEPVVEELGEGAYRVSNVVFTMSGEWELRLRAARDDIMDEASFDYDVP